MTKDKEEIKRKFSLMGSEANGIARRRTEEKYNKKTRRKRE